MVLTEGAVSVLVEASHSTLMAGRLHRYHQLLDRRLDYSVPLTMGSQRSHSIDVGPFQVTEAWFGPGLILPPHLHERTTFAVMLEGSFDLHFGSRSYDCTPSTVFTEPLGEKHGNRVGTKGAHVLVLQPDHRREELFRPCRHLFEMITHTSHGGIKALALRMAHELHAADSARSLALQGLGFEMLSAASRTVSSRSSQPPAWLRRAEEKIRSAFLDDVDLDAIAEAAGIHPAHLARAFRKHYHESVGAFVRRLRLEWALAQLTSTSDAIAEIALKAGFADQSHFTRAFKKHVGVPPGRFRKAVRD